MEYEWDIVLVQHFAIPKRLWVECVSVEYLCALRGCYSYSIRYLALAIEETGTIKQKKIITKNVNKNINIPMCKYYTHFGTGDWL